MIEMPMNVLVLSLVSASLDSGSIMGTRMAQAAEDNAPHLQLAQTTDDTVEKEAFEAAKELGTVEAWDAFLSNYPRGFRADLARAYVKKLANQAGEPATATAPVSNAVMPMMKPTIGMMEMAPAFSSVASTSRAGKLPCSDAGALASKSSMDPARISFINYSPDPVDVFWIDEKGAQQLYGQINKGRQATVETFVTQPWVLKYLDGTCLMIALPRPGPQIFTIGDALGGRSGRPSRSPSTSKQAIPSGSSNSSSCGSGRIRVEEKCMSRSQAVSFCGPGFRVVGSKCVHQNDVGKVTKPSKTKCPKGQIWSKLEGCHHDD